MPAQASLILTITCNCLKDQSHTAMLSSTCTVDPKRSLSLLCLPPATQRVQEILIIAICISNSSLLAIILLYTICIESIHIIKMQCVPDDHGWCWCTMNAPCTMGCLDSLERGIVERWIGGIVEWWNVQMTTLYRHFLLIAHALYDKTT